MPNLDDAMPVEMYGCTCSHMDTVSSDERRRPPARLASTSHACNRPCNGVASAAGPAVVRAVAEGATDGWVL